MSNIYALKGNICHSKNSNEIEVVENGYLICENGISQGVYARMPEKYQGIEVIDHKDNLIIPGLVDMHVHAPQYSFRGLGMDLELIDWLNNNTFPAEAKYKELDYAEKAYQIFVKDLAKGATTRASIFATIHTPATELLMDMLEKSGLKTYVGRVNMDRNSPDELREESAEKSAADTRLWLDGMKDKYKNTEAILTPRFIPSCTDELMKYLADIQKEYGLPLQSHLSENPGEIAWVQELCPDSRSYGDAYDQLGTFGGYGKTIMAHVVHPTELDLELMKKQDIYVAHCPSSNTNLSSGIAPVRTFIEQGIKTGLGSDVAGGFTTSIFRAMTDAIQVSKLRWRLQDDSLKPLTVAEAFYLGTKGGGEFFGKVGCFDKGYEMDAVILTDENLETPDKLTTAERLERLIYLSDERNILRKYVAGKVIL